MTQIRTLRRCAVVFVVTVSGLTITGCADTRPMHGIAIEDPAAAPPLKLRDAAGAVYDLSAERGRAVLVYFGYTHCPDVCPATLSDWARARRALGARANRARFVFVSVDPDRDTPQQSRSYALQFDSSFVGLTASAADLDGLKKDWGIAAFREETGDAKGYGMAHPGQTFVIDANGKLRMIFPPGTKPDDIASDLSRLM